MADREREGLVRRLAVTLLVPIGVLLATRLPAPGIPDELAGDPALRSKLGLFTLGVTPIISAYVLVELVALAVPRWNRLRHAGEAARAKLELSARILMLVIAAAQAYAIAVYLDAYPLGGIQVNVVLVVASQVGAVAVLYLAARWITRRGLTNGLLLLMALFAARDLAGAMSTAVATKRAMGELDARHIGLLAFGVALPVIAALLALGGVTFGASGDTELAESPYREEGGRLRPLRSWVPVPASSIYPYTAAGSLLMLPATLRHLGLPIPSPAPGLAASLWLIGLVVVLGGLFSFLFQRPSAVAAVARQLGMAAPDSEDDARAAIRRALLPTFLFLACLVLARSILWGSHAPDIGIATCLFVAIALDFGSSVRALHADPGRVVVWHERRPYATTAVCAGLRAHGIEARPRGLLALGLLSFFAPYAPAEITVPAADAGRAGELLEGWFVHNEPEHAAETSPEPGAPERPPVPEWNLGRALPLAVAAAAGVAALLLTRQRVPPPANVHPATLQIEAVDDMSHPLDHVAVKDVPRDIELETEDVPAGLDQSGDVFTSEQKYAVALTRHGESAVQTRARLLGWLARFHLPPGEHFAAEDIYGTSPADGRQVLNGARSFALKGPPIITSADIADAAPAPIEDPFGRITCNLRVSLTRRGAQRFLAATRRLVQHRMALVLDGVVATAPVVQSAIPGGQLSITMASTQDSCPDARRFAAELRAGVKRRGGAHTRGR